MGNGFHFDLSAIVIAIVSSALSLGVAGAIYYVKTQAQGAASSGVQKATDALTSRLEQLGGLLMQKVDGIREELARVNVTLGRSEERTEHNSRAIERLDERVTRLERSGE